MPEERYHRLTVELARWREAWLQRTYFKRDLQDYAPKPLVPGKVKYVFGWIIRNNGEYVRRVRIRSGL